MLHNIPSNVQHGVKSLLNTTGPFELLNFSFSGGGCINQGGRLKTTSGDFFLKWNDAKKFPSMFETEAKGLRLLRDATVIDVPEIIGFGEEGTNQFLVLVFVEQGAPLKQYWENLGIHLALLHRMSASSFGLDHNNYIGSLRQFNQQNSSWIKFFIEQRLNVQLKLAADAGLLNSTWVKNFEMLSAKLPSLLPEEIPSLLHGDLWSGNLISNEKGNPCLIDPAVYYGSREADLAMTQLFGRFSEEFYTAYEETFPLLPGHAKRVDLYNLYPLLVHLNLFGREYLRNIISIVRSYI